MAPVFVLEIASRSTFRRDLHTKPVKYAEMGVTEYWRFDPTGGKRFNPPLAGEHRRDGRWEPISILTHIDGTLTAHSTALGLDLCWQSPKLRLCDPATGTWLRDAKEETAARKAAEARAAALEARAAKEFAARAAAEAELAALRQQLANQPPH